MLRSNNCTWAWPSPCFPVANTLVDWQVTTAYDQVEDRFAKLMHWWDWQSYAVCLQTVSNPPKNMCRKTPPFSASLLASFGLGNRVFTQESWYVAVVVFQRDRLGVPQTGWRPAKSWWMQAPKANCSRNSWITQIGIDESMRRRTGLYPSTFKATGSHMTEVQIKAPGNWLAKGLTRNLQWGKSMP